jgi:hypothetical protein
MRIRPINKFLKFFLGKKVIGITLCPFGIYLSNVKIDQIDSEPSSVKYTLNHEKIHWKQQLEMLVIPFYFLYCLEFFIKGYRGISFEREAYNNEKNLGYLNNRRHYSWVKYIFRK